MKNVIEEMIRQLKLFGSAAWESCMVCNPKESKQNFGNWTSGNKKIDKFIQKAQLKVKHPYEFLEWIPYNRLKNVKFHTQGGLNEVYMAFWLDRPIMHWDHDKQDWDRILFDLGQDYGYGYPVVLKNLNGSSKVNKDCLKKVN